MSFDTSFRSAMTVGRFRDSMRGENPPFAPRVLAALFPNTELSTTLAASGEDLRAAYQALPVGQQRSIEDLCGSRSLEELYSLADELDAEMFYAGLLDFGVRQERSGNTGLATRIYSAVAEAAATQALSAPLRQDAQARLDAILGRGPIGNRFKSLLPRLIYESCEPSSLLAMGAAGALFKVARLGILSRLVASPMNSFWTRGIGAQALASTVAYGLEAPAFALSSHLASEAMGRHQAGSLGRDIESSYLLLGGMRVAGLGANAVVGVVRAWPLQVAIQQGGMLSGILLGHRLERAFNLRDQPGATTLIDSLELLLQFNVSGHLTQHAFGESFHAWEQRLELQSRLLAQSPLGTSSSKSPEFHRFSFVGFDPALEGVTGDPLKKFGLSIMQNTAGGNDGNEGSGRGKVVKPRRHPLTQHGIGGEPRSPFSVFRYPLFSWLKPYRIEGVSKKALFLRVQSREDDSMAKIMGALQSYFETEREPVVISWESEHLLNLSYRKMLSGMHRLFLEKKLPEDLVVTVAAPSEGFALQFSNPRINFNVTRVKLKGS